MTDSKALSGPAVFSNGDRDKSRASQPALDKTAGLIMKSMLDFTLSSIGLIFLLPFFWIIGMMIRKDSPGGVFYWSPRVGKGGKVFKMLKFRTMYEAPESYSGPRVTVKGDRRITPFGAWLRDTKINELPQLWNVVKGEMSLVGPRPEDPDIARDWPEESKQEILSVKPGITSPASILYHDEESRLESSDVMGSYFNDILPDKMRLDRLYVRHQSFFSDIDIIFWTLVVILPLLARTPIPEGYLFSGPTSRFFHRYFNWFVLDLITSMVSITVVGVLWRSQVIFNWGEKNLFLLSLSIALLFSGVNSLAGLNRINWPRATLDNAFTLGLSGACVTLVLLVLDYLQNLYTWFDLPSLPIAMILTTGMVAFGGFFLTRYRGRVITAIASRWVMWRKDRSEMGERILIVGSGEGCQTATWFLNRERFLYAFTVIGVIDDDVLDKKDMRIDGFKVLGRFNDLQALVKKNDVGLILLTDTSLPPEVNSVVMDLVKSNSVRLVHLDKVIRLMDHQLLPQDLLHSNFLGPEVAVEFLATHSDITCLPNLYLFKYHLSHSLAYSKRYKNDLAVLLINLEGFRNIKKTLGPGLGNQILREMSNRLARCKRESDMLAQLDETTFGIILENIPDHCALDVIYNRMSAILNEPMNIDGQFVKIHPIIRSFSGSKECEDSRLINELPTAY